MMAGVGGAVHAAKMKRPGSIRRRAVWNAFSLGLDLHENNNQGEEREGFNEYET